MTLYRQLLVFMVTLFCVLYVGTWYAKLQSTRNFLVNQLESHAQDTATSLGLSISPHMAAGDLVTVETMISAVFDRGYYKTIKLQDIDNRSLYEQTLKIEIENIPAWFIRMTSLESPGATAIVMSGWNQAGTIYVQSHTGFAYKSLWDSSINTAILFVIAGTAVIILGSIGVAVLLRPLRRVEQQAEALCHRKYQIQDPLPKTRELRQVVSAMNKMTKKVKTMFHEQAAIAEKLRKNAYSDVLTGLGNRRYIDGQVTARVDRKGMTLNGAFLLIQIRNLQELNQKKGFEAGDKLVKRVAQILRKSTKTITNSALARLTGGDFVAFMPDAAKEDAEHVAARISKEFSRLAGEHLSMNENLGHIGGIAYDHPCSFCQLLAEADAVLSAAQQRGVNGWEIQSLSETLDDMPQGEQEWKTTFTSVLANKKLHLFGQSVVTADPKQRPLQREIFSRIPLPDQQKIISAGVFIPIAERLSLVSSFDRIVLEKIFLIDKSRYDFKELAVNISPASLQDTSFIRWILQQLKKGHKRLPRLVFEFTEFTAVQHLEDLQSFSLKVKKLGHDIALDHFGQSLTNFGYLKSLHPAYVKIDRAFTGELDDENSDSYFFIGSLCAVAHSLDIHVIAEGVEEEKQFQMLCDLHLDGVQGYFIAKPAEIIVE